MSGYPQTDQEWTQHLERLRTQYLPDGEGQDCIIPKSHLPADPFSEKIAPVQDPKELGEELTRAREAAQGSKFCLPLVASDRLYLLSETRDGVRMLTYAFIYTTRDRSCFYARRLARANAMSLQQAKDKAAQMAASIRERVKGEQQAASRKPAAKPRRRRTAGKR